ncbi:MAG: AbrB/MazE/SpoVT family DNA-binding domain-containing protein [Halobacteria archaeon]|nr:AbrB/MazE/SpoVT family DNA-binding domain-containing protein [Halobacteria archaeon]
MTTKADNGRIYLPKELREKHGEKYRIVDSGDHLLLIPVSDNPLEELREEWEEVDKSVEEMRDEAREMIARDPENDE